MQDRETQKYFRMGLSETIVIVSLLFLGGPTMTQSFIVGCTFIAIAGGLCSLGAYAVRHTLRSRLGKWYPMIQMLIVMTTIGVVFVGSYLSIGEITKTIVSGILAVLIGSLLWFMMHARRRRWL